MHPPAGSLLHPLVAVEDAFQQLRHEGLEVGVGGLGHHPVGIATQGPAGNGAHQGLLVTQTLDEVRDELGQVGNHALHAASRMGREMKELLRACDYKTLDSPVNLDQ